MANVASASEAGPAMILAMRWLFLPLRRYYMRDLQKVEWHRRGYRK